MFASGGVLYRQVNPVGRTDYDALMTSGLYDHLSRAGDLVRHEEVDLALSPDGRAVAALRPERMDFISYPYEWCFGQL